MGVMTRNEGGVEDVTSRSSLAAHFFRDGIPAVCVLHRERLAPDGYVRLAKRMLRYAWRAEREARCNSRSGRETGRGWGRKEKKGGACVSKRYSVRFRNSLVPVVFARSEEAHFLCLFFTSLPPLFFSIAAYNSSRCCTHRRAFARLIPSILSRLLLLGGCILVPRIAIRGGIWVAQGRDNWPGPTRHGAETVAFFAVSGPTCMMLLASVTTLLERWRDGEKYAEGLLFGRGNLGVVTGTVDTYIKVPKSFDTSRVFQRRVGRDAP
ncbi:uncharacterized protein P884DRAFT_28078 [Thermothelomyces heterothallicus CBS 202.75]|uniref:uncharacterized protein n=1 Tax=Thermothelomyces heterothallicus CBS 202.75 TaxID=1149848 RepID=UPI0037437C4E